MAGSHIGVTPGNGANLATGPTYTEASTVVQDQKIILGEGYLATYSVSTASALSTGTAASHLLQIMAGASLNVYLRRLRVWQFGVATTAAIVTLQVFRLTSAGTGGTAITPSPFAADGASGATAMTLPTVKGTEGTLLGITSTMFIQTVPTGGPAGAPLLADWQWDGLRTEAIRIPAGTANGIALKNPSAVAGATIVAEAIFSEAPF